MDTQAQATMQENYVNALRLVEEVMKPVDGSPDQAHDPRLLEASRLGTMCQAWRIANNLIGQLANALGTIAATSQAALNQPVWLESAYKLDQKMREVYAEPIDFGNRFMLMAAASQVKDPSVNLQDPVAVLNYLQAQAQATPATPATPAPATPATPAPEPKHILEGAKLSEAKPSEEWVLGFDTVHLQEAGLFNGLELNVDKYLYNCVRSRLLYYRPRSRAEEDQTFKQVIPYVLLTREGKILRYTRGQKGQEARLRNRKAIGFGGHINTEDDQVAAADGDKVTPIVVGMHREVAEESGYVGLTLEPVAVLNDDSNPVGKVHFGLVYMGRVGPGQEPQNLEPGQQDNLAWLTPEELLAEIDQHEGWSQLCIRRLPELLAAFGNLGATAG